MSAAPSKLPPEQREHLVDALAVISLLEKAKVRQPRLAFDLQRIIDGLRAEIDTITVEAPTHGTCGASQENDT